MKYREFLKCAGQVWGEDLRKYELEDFLMLGNIHRNDLPVVKEIVAAYPDLHFISYLRDGDVIVNKLVEDAWIYNVGNGDADPELITSLSYGLPDISKMTDEEFKAHKKAFQRDGRMVREMMKKESKTFELYRTNRINQLMSKKK
jgi:hypothetical protein